LAANFGAYLHVLPSAPVAFGGRANRVELCCTAAESTETLNDRPSSGQQGVQALEFGIEHTRVLAAQTAIAQPFTRTDLSNIEPRTRC